MERYSGGSTRRNREFIVVTALALAVAIGIALRSSGGGMAANAYAIAEAEYPETPPFPSEDDFIDPETGEWDGEAFDRVFDPWFDFQRARWLELPEDYAAGLKGFFISSIPQFLSGADGENRVYSPVNVCMALSMLAELTDGDSREQILTLLGQDSIQDLRTWAAAM